jgi:uncharacterized membrane protein YidH (DUF202 family)
LSSRPAYGKEVDAVIEKPDDDDTQWHRRVLYYHRIRTDLSNERKYLGWLGVSLGMISLGFVVERVDLFLARMGGDTAPELPRLLSWAPLLIFAMGATMVVVASWEFFADRRNIARCEERRSPLRITLLLMTLVSLVVIAALLLAVHPV